MNVIVTLSGIMASSPKSDERNNTIIMISTTTKLLISEFIMPTTMLSCQTTLR